MLRSFFRRSGARSLIAAGLAVLAAAVFSAEVIGDAVNRSPEATPGGVVTTVPATRAQVAGAGLAPGFAVAAAAKPATRTVIRTATIQSRITTTAISTEEGKGTFVGIRCPAGSKAVSGGVISNFINLLISSSAPNNPKNGKYTPGIWWVAVTNENIDGTGGTLAWRGVVNCVSPLRLKSPATSGP